MGGKKTLELAAFYIWARGREGERFISTQCYPPKIRLWKPEKWTKPHRNWIWVWTNLIKLQAYLRVGSADENQDSPESFVGWSPAWGSLAPTTCRSQFLPLTVSMENLAKFHKHTPLWKVYGPNSVLLGNTVLHPVFKPKEKYWNEDIIVHGRCVSEKLHWN